MGEVEEILKEAHEAETARRLERVDHAFERVEADQRQFSRSARDNNDEGTQRSQKLEGDMNMSEVTAEDVKNFVGKKNDAELKDFLVKRGDSLGLDIKFKGDQNIAQRVFGNAEVRSVSKELAMFAAKVGIVIVFAGGAYLVYDRWMRPTGM